MKNSGYVYFMLRKANFSLKPRYKRNIAKHGWGIWWLGFYIGGGM